MVFEVCDTVKMEKGLEKGAEVFYSYRPFLDGAKSSTNGHTMERGEQVATTRTTESITQRLPPPFQASFAI